MKIKTIFFDTSDTLYHNSEFEKAQSLQPIFQLSKIKNLSFDEANKLFIKTKEDLKNKMIHVPKVEVMMKLGITRIEMQESLAKIDTKKFLKPDEKLNIIIKRMNENYQLGIITNILEKFLNDILETLRINKNYFKYLVTVDNTNKSKPHEEPFLKALQLSKCKPEECVYIGDSLTKDIIPAKKVGMKTIWISKDSIKDKNTDIQIKSIYEVENAISKIEK